MGFNKGGSGSKKLVPSEVQVATESVDLQVEQQAGRNRNQLGEFSAHDEAHDEAMKNVVFFLFLFFFQVQYAIYIYRIIYQERKIGFCG